MVLCKKLRYTRKHLQMLHDTLEIAHQHIRQTEINDLLS